MYLSTASEMREMDRRTIESFGIPGRVLMENAGRGVVRILLEIFPGIESMKVGIAAGKGNNGGDGFVVARYLNHKGINATVFLLADPKGLKGDAKANFDLLENSGVPVRLIRNGPELSNLSSEMAHQQLWVDAIFGTGLSSEVRGHYKDMIDFMNNSSKPTVAVDIPSGIDTDTSFPLGSAVKADCTVTFGAAKIGHVTEPGRHYTGKLRLIDIGIPPDIVHQVDPKAFFLNDGYVRSFFKPRKSDFHKGDGGHLLVLAGSTGKSGAAAMAALSAMRAGGGLVTLGVPQCINSLLEPMVTEVMTEPLPDTASGGLDETGFDAVMKLASGKSVLVLGPGLGTNPPTIRLLHRLIKEIRIPMVIDADGINCLAEDPIILKKLRAPAVLTPHPGEMGRLAGISTADVQVRRLEIASEFAVKYGVYLVLKGARTVIANPEGKTFINPTGNPGMGSGGMGDVLTGLIAGFISQGYRPEDAALMGVYLHGDTADYLSRKTGPWGYLASEVMDHVPLVLGTYFNKELRSEVIAEI